MPSQHFVSTIPRLFRTASLSILSKKRTISPGLSASFILTLSPPCPVICLSELAAVNSKTLNGMLPPFTCIFIVDSGFLPPDQSHPQKFPNLSSHLQECSLFSCYPRGRR